MEQAVNLFTKCLLMDTNPMVLGNDTLIDVLNGTFVTMNGDEIILQNDMGNRRVADAFLPAGFEPVGIKEYGGVIYVASYNPITNLSLIGSFPSPLRKYSSYDYNNENIEPPTIILSYTEEGDPFRSLEVATIKFLYDDSYLKRLIDLKFVPGSKFITTYEEEKNLDNTYKNEFSLVTKTNDEKNSLYSLYYGIINSLNLFIDITNMLNKYNNHFLVNSFSEPNEWNDSTLDDKEFELARLKWDMNTYSGKLVGYPYIKVQLNHPVNFRYTITGKRVGNKIKLKIMGTIEYNCPDFKNTEVFEKESNEYTNKLDEDYKKTYGFSLYARVKKVITLQ